MKYAAVINLMFEASDEEAAKQAVAKIGKEIWDAVPDLPVPTVDAKLVPTRDIPSSNKIVMFFHCRKCMDDKPKNVTPRDWASLEAGWTEIGFQVWCKRCEANLVHMDFGGTRHRANSTRAK